jgi:predicted nucleic acid-binding protein
MATYFLDTSALVKRHVAEPGHAWVEALCNPGGGNTIVISEAALVEVIAAFSRMARETPPRMSTAERDQVIADFDILAASEYTVVLLARSVIARAATLCRAHPLRAYDAVQLGCALTRRDDDLAAGHPAPTFVCADAGLLTIAQAEGFTVENPNAFP